MSRDKERGGWELVYRIDGHRTRERGATQDECEAKRARRLAALDAAPGTPAGASMTLSGLASEYERLAGVRPTTVRNRTLALRRLIEQIGDRDVRTVSTLDLSRTFAAMADDGLARSTIIETRKALGTVFEFAVDHDLVATNVVRRSKVRGGAESREARMLELDDARVLTKTLAADGSGIAVAFALMLHAGLRLGEATGLSWADVDLSAGTVVVRRQLLNDGTLGPVKTKASNRTVGLSAPLAAILADRRARYPDAVYVAGTGEAPQPRSSLYPALARTLRTAGVAAVNLHGLRHTAGSILYAATKDLTEVAAFLGHDDLTLVMTTYVHRVESTVPGAGLAGVVW